MWKRVMAVLLATLCLFGILLPSAHADDTVVYSDELWKNGSYDTTLGDMAGRRLYVYGIVDSEAALPEQATDADIVLNADQPAGRLDAALCFYRLSGNASDAELCPFPDVPEEFAEAVAWLSSAGIIKGVGGGLFGTGSITEWQLLLMLSRLLGWGTEDRGELYRLGEEKGLLPTGKRLETVTRGDLFRILCAVIDNCLPEKSVPVREEMSVPKRLTIEAESYASAEAQIAEAAMFVPSRMVICFSDECPEDDLDAFVRDYDCNVCVRDVPIMKAVNPLYSPLWMLIRKADRKYELRINRYSPAYLAYADTMEWLRVYLDEAFSRSLKDFADQELLPLRELPTEYERAKAAHDLLCRLVSYDYECYGGNRPEGHRLLGFIQNRMLVCDGYANVYQWMLSYLGVRCYVVIGKTDSEVHAWNKVMLDGQWYNVDACWDDGATVILTYFLKSDSSFETNRHSFTDRYSTSVFSSSNDYGS